MLTKNQKFALLTKISLKNQSIFIVKHIDFNKSTNIQK